MMETKIFPKIRAEDGTVTGGGRSASMKTVFTDTGLIIKTGTIVLDNKSATVLTLSPPFPNACVSVQASCGQVGFAAISAVSAAPNNSSSINAFQMNQANVGMNVTFVAIGY